MTSHQRAHDSRQPVVPGAEAVANGGGLALTDEVRASCAAVAERARFVAIERKALPAYPASLPLADVARPTLDPTYHYLGDTSGTVAFVLTLDSINFGSGYFPQMRKRGALSGYFTVALSLKESFERDGPWTAGELAA